MNIFERFKKEKKESLFDESIRKEIEVLKEAPSDSERHWQALQSLENQIALEKSRIGDDTESQEKGFKYIAKRIFEGLTDPKVIAAALGSLVYIWWGDRCMKYDESGKIPPNRMLQNGPKPPNV